MSLKTTSLTALVFLAVSSSARAELVSYVCTDPIGDNASTIDLARMRIDFDNDNALYRITLDATEERPFSGNFRININLFNPDTGSTGEHTSAVNDVLNEFDLDEPVTRIVLNGGDASFLYWSAGDRVATSSDEGLGMPDETNGFFTSIIRLDSGAGDLAFEDVPDNPATGTACVPAATVPPLKATSVSDGSTSGAAISGGATSDGAMTFSDRFTPGDVIELHVRLQPDASDLGKTAEVFVIMAAGSRYYLLTPLGIGPFSGLSGLVPFSELLLEEAAELNMFDPEESLILNIFEPFGGGLTLTPAMKGTYAFFTIKTTTRTISPEGSAGRASQHRCKVQQIRDHRSDR